MFDSISFIWSLISARSKIFEFCDFDSSSGVSLHLSQRFCNCEYSEGFSRDLAKVIPGWQLKILFYDFIDVFTYFVYWHRLYKDDGENRLFWCFRGIRKS
jgi:hypothetical protein